MRWPLVARVKWVSERAYSPATFRMIGVSDRTSHLTSGCAMNSQPCREMRTTEFRKLPPWPIALHREFLPASAVHTVRNTSTPLSETIPPLKTLSRESASHGIRSRTEKQQCVAASPSLMCYHYPTNSDSTPRPQRHFRSLDLTTRRHWAMASIQTSVLIPKTSEIVISTRTPIALMC